MNGMVKSPLSKLAQQSEARNTLFTVCRDGTNTILHNITLFPEQELLLRVATLFISFITSNWS